MKEIKIKYHFEDIPRLEKIEKGNWIDLYTAEDIIIRPFERKKIDLGISMELPDGYEAIMAPRSSTYEKFNILQTNGIGVIDFSYMGDNDNWMMSVLHIPEFKEGVSRGDWFTKEITIPKHTRLCQFRILGSQGAIDFKEVDFLENKDRGGFGTTGV